MYRIQILTILFVSMLTGTTATANDSLPMVLESKFEIFISDPAESREFYSVLGFRVAHAKADGYTTLRSGSTVVALSPVPWWLPLRWLGLVRHPPIGTEIVLYTAHLEQLRSLLVGSGYSPGEIELQSWGNRDFRVRDPDGYYLRISEGSP
jgi:catechol 2,3-dioxygenase-like lactoylglutathione lyase family enzyme